MRRNLIRFATALLGSTFGLTGCPVAEYGMPHATFDLDGTVLGAGTDSGVEGLTVSFDGNEATTGADGTWTMTEVSAFPCGDNCSLTVTDTDGDDNGAYDEEQVTFAASQVEEGDGSWDEGRWEATGITVEVDPATR